MTDVKEGSSYSVSVGILAQLVRYLSYLQVDLPGFFQSAGLDAGIMEAPDERITVEQYILIEDTAAQITNDPCFGLHMGQFIEAGNWSILGYMMMNCGTLAEAFEKAAKYSSIIGNLIEEDMQTSEDIFTIFLKVPQQAPAISRHCYEGYLSSMICIARILTGKNVSPVEVGFAFSESGPLEEYEKVFGCPVLFEREQSYIKIAGELMDTPVLLPNKSLLQYFEKYAEEFLAENEAVPEVAYQVKKLILSHMDEKRPSIVNIAKELTMSVRSLQIHLKKEGTEFGRLLRETREQLAKKYLRHNYRVEDITYLLGFDDPSVFRKAFKKWTGMTPRVYRENNICVK